MDKIIKQFVVKLSRRLKVQPSKVHDSTLGERWLLPYKGRISNNEIANMVRTHFNKGNHIIKGFDSRSMVGTLLIGDKVEGVLAVQNETHSGIPDISINASVPKCKAGCCL